MKIQKASELRKMSEEGLQDRIASLRSELSKLNISAGRGTLKKESGSIKVVRRNIARVLTVMNEKGQKNEEGAAE
uniref:Large ribosomal subunit protein uL29 n=1 Tax=uncultured thaumarchaeote Rifle_16ft_4_minimus_11813 TaxID=1665208 RepID=A0A0H4T0C3_9ARCH|nr:50S ribosomal protein L29p [uncultured thaumarchaeote Rifle_16ft_4_minimus_11813]